MKRPASHRSSNEDALPIVTIISVLAAELSQLCTSAAQLHNAIGNQYYHGHAGDDTCIPPSSSTLPSEEPACADAVQQAPATRAMQHYQLASEMLLLAEEYREPTSSACAALFDTTSVDGSAADNDMPIASNAETSLNFMMDYVADLEQEYSRCLLTTASVTFGSMSQGTPLNFTMSTPPNEQAAAVFYNMSLVSVLLGDEDRAVDFLSMVEELCQESSSLETKSCQHVEETKQKPTSHIQDRRAEVELLALSVVSSAKASSSSSSKMKPERATNSTKVKVVDTTTLLQVGKSHAIRSKNFVMAEGSAESDPSSSACSVPTVLPSYEKTKFGIFGGSGNPANGDLDGLAGCDADDDCLSQSSEPW